MAGRKTLAMTDRQFAVLRVFWERGSLTVRQLMEHLPGGEGQPYTTVLGMLQTMEKAGLIRHEEEGASYRYTAAVSREAALGTLLRDFVGRFFRGSAEDLVVGLVDAKELSAQDLRDIEARLKPPSANGGAGKPRRRTP
ncbi:MAG TPA: BlaI/MecI/CopY family transcriptional regulator [Gemmataceae bacterium]|nr:BlaI/MecI/CopY family transcriptional regulator [Gemmataceae bacterium]